MFDLSAHVIPALACGEAGIYGQKASRASMAAVIYFRPFFLIRKGQRIKADIIGPNARCGRFPAMSAVARAPNPVKGRRSQCGILLWFFN